MATLAAENKVAIRMDTPAFRNLLDLPEHTQRLIRERIDEVVELAGEGVEGMTAVAIRGYRLVFEVETDAGTPVVTLHELSRTLTPLP